MECARCFAEIKVCDYFWDKLGNGELYSIAYGYDGIGFCCASCFESAKREEDSDNSDED